MNHFLLKLLKLFIQAVEEMVGKEELPADTDIYGNKDTPLQAFMRKARGLPMGFGDGDEEL